MKPFFWAVVCVGMAMCCHQAVAAERVIDLSGRWLLFPVKNGAAKRMMNVMDGTSVLHRISIELAPGEPDWLAPLDVGVHVGKRLTVQVADLPAESEGLARIRSSAENIDPKGLYSEPLRPQFHFSPRLGWNNDPNGLSYVNGEWHLFYQHNPYGVGWGNMHWAHAVSRDLVRWQDLGDVLYPDERGTVFSGSAVVDTADTAGFGAGAHVLVYTAAGNPFTQNLAYGTDGRTYTKWTGNPVVAQLSGGNRDPKVFWHEPIRQWVMVFYGKEDGRHVFYVMNSPDLKKWTRVGTIRGDEAAKGSYLYECPELFELPIDGGSEKRWVTFGANGQYAVGTFDGKKFTPEAERLASSPAGHAAYAAQTFNHAPDGRRILTAWFRLSSHGSRFSQAMTLPQTLGLTRTPDGIRLTREPIRELETLRDGPAVSFDRFNGELVEGIVDCSVGASAAAVFSLRGVPVVYDRAKGTLKAGTIVCPWPASDGRLVFRFFIDRAGVEIFSGDRLHWIALGCVPPASDRRLSLTPSQGVTDHGCRAWRLRTCHAAGTEKHL